MPSNNEVLVLSSSDIEQLLDVDLAIASQQVAFEALGRGEALLPARLLVDGAEDSVSFCYAARLTRSGGAVCKFGSVNPANTGLGIPTVSATITVLDGADGRPVAIMDGTTVTTLRTSAASAVAVRALASTGSRRMAVIGSGVQADAHVRALSRVLKLETVRIWGTNPERAHSLAGHLREEFDFEVRVEATAETAVRESDVVVCCTTSSDPVFEAAWLEHGATVVSIGSFTPDRSEVPQELVEVASAIVVDDVDTAVEHAGPVVQAISSGLISPERLSALGEVVTGRSPGRTQQSDIVYYNSVGIGVQDAAAAIYVLEAAHAAGRGQRVTL